MIYEVPLSPRRETARMDFTKKGKEKAAKKEGSKKGPK